MYSPRIQPRRGFTILECVVAAGMLSVVFVLVGQLFVWNGRERRAAWNRQVAAQEAANQLERLSLLPYESLTAERLATMQLSADAREWLGGGSLRVVATEVTSPRPGRRLEVEVHGAVKNHAEVPPVRLVTWRFAPGGGP